MLDINKIRKEKELVKKALLKRMAVKDLDLDTVIALDDKRRKFLQAADSLKAERNKYSKTKPSPDIIKKMKEIGDKIKKFDEQIKEVEEELKDKFTVGVLVDKELPVYDEEYEKVRQWAQGKVNPV